jgi:glycosyltransferase involved in cell wall biosynthesis
MAHRGDSTAGGASRIALPIAGSAELETARGRERRTSGRAVEKPNGRRRVLGIMYSFPPAREIGAQSCSQICRYLPDYGWDVSVLTVKEKYIPGADQHMRDGFPGTVIRTGVIPHPLWLYGKLKSLVGSDSESAQAIVGRTDDVQQPGGGFRKWLLSMLLIPDRYTGWILPAIISGLGEIRRQRVDCLFSSGPWWTNHVVGLALADLTGLPLVAHFRDPWSQAEWLKPVSNLSVRIEKALERRVMTKASAVVSVGEMQTALVQQAYPALPASKFVTIFNGYDGAEWDELFGDKTAAPAPANDKFTITYAGSLYFRRSPYPLFYALQSLIESGEIPREHIRLELLGKCEVADGKRVRDVIESCGLADCVDNVGFVNRFPETLRLIARSDLLLLCVDQAYQIPAKTYEYLRAGRPILALTSGGDVVNLLNRAGGAWIADPDDNAGISSAVLEAYRSWRNGVDARSPDPDVVARFDRRKLAGQFAQVFDNCIAGGGQTVVGTS